METLLRLLRLLAKTLLNQWVWRISPAIAYSFSHRKNPIQATFSWPDTALELGPRVVLFVHFDSVGDVRPYVCDYLRGLQAAGLSVVFASNSGSLKPEAIERIKPFCAGILVRRNIGYDFAAMREGLVHFGLPRANTEMLVIANDSVYGPLVPLDDMLARVDFEKADFWAATESWQLRYHLQSYFVIAGPRLLHHPAWASFWNNVRSVPSKHWVIREYEVGMTQWMIRAGISCAALWRYEALVDSARTALLTEGRLLELVNGDPVPQGRRNQSLLIKECYARSLPLNPTSDMWRQLLLAGFPFLKRELLRENPSCVSDVMDWRNVVEQVSQSDISAIEQDLRQVVRNRAP